MQYTSIPNLETFIGEDLHVSDAERTQFALEDIYTPTDKAILESTSFRSYTPQKLFELRENINKLIKLAVRETIKHSTEDDTYVKKFAEYVVEQCNHVRSPPQLCNDTKAKWDKYRIYKRSIRPFQRKNHTELFGKL